MICEHLSKLPLSPPPPLENEAPHPLNLHDFEEGVDLGISVPSFMEICDLSELSCMSLSIKTLQAVMPNGISGLMGSIHFCPTNMNIACKPHT